MASKKPKPASHGTAANSTQAVDEFMLILIHSFKKEIEAIRSSILDTDRTIAGGIKWKAPSFRTTDYFATMNLREKKGIGVILHPGAKVRDLPSGGMAIDDHVKLLKWLGKDRAMIVFKDLTDFTSKKSAFERIVEQWIGHL